MNSIILLNKHEGISSAEALNRLKKKFQIPSLGHAGTLDPFATGLLVAASNRATKILPYFQDLPKEYLAKIQLGFCTDTDDRTGKIMEQSDRKVLIEEMLPEVLPRFEGWIDQVPPSYSALKVQGQRAYKLARENVPLVLASRKVHVHSLKVESFSEENQNFTLRVICSKGTYIRALGRDLGRALGSVASLLELERSAIGPYRVSQAMTVENIKKENFQGIEDIFSHYPAFSLKEEYLKKVLNGSPISPYYLSLKGGHMEEGYAPSFYRLYTPQNQFLGIVQNQTARFLYRTL